MAKLRDLHRVHAEPGAPSPGAARVRCAWELRGSFLEARFEVSSPGIHVNPALPTDRSQHGLWDWDVVEVFLSASGDPSGTPYLETQVSPLGQFFELKVLEPRKRFEEGFASGFRREATRRGSGDWSAKLEIPLGRLGWNGDPSALRGGFFAILGAPGARTYWGMFLPVQEKPDFHLPGLFRPLCDQSS